MRDSRIIDLFLDTPLDDAIFRFVNACAEACNVAFSEGVEAA
jgi:hypothetical protein